MSIKVVITGASGRMGKMLISNMQREDMQHLTLHAAVDLASSPEQGQDAGTAAGVAAIGVNITTDFESVIRDADVVVDFTKPASTAAMALQCAAAKTAMVIGTTGLDELEQHIVANSAQQAPIVMAPNMSLGVNLLFKLVNQAARALAGKGYDPEIIERHHRHKKDAPSGTAQGLGRYLADGLGWDLKQTAIHGREGMSPGSRPDEQIAFHAVRGGDIVGDHTVLFAGEGELIELSHRATSRNAFAIGALRAAAWVVGKPAKLYSMQDVLGLA